MININSGYDGFSMSNRAVEAYNNGEKPLSKWTKSTIVEEIENIYDYEEFNFSMELFKKLSLADMKYFIEESSWHHTSNRFNKTYFYSLDIGALSILSDEDIKDRIEKRNQINATGKKDKFEKGKEINYYITAIAEYDVWEGSRKHPKKTTYKEIVRFRSVDKLVNVKNDYSKKRLSSLTIKFEIKQKTKYVENEIIEKKYASQLKKGV